MPQELPSPPQYLTLCSSACTQLLPICCIHCAGTNFLIRAAAFKEAGWSPEYTLTEDFALGMELKKRRWQCRYVEEYLAVGEAPDEVRNCFQQRSRWAKGVRPPALLFRQGVALPAVLLCKVVRQAARLPGRTCYGHVQG